MNLDKATILCLAIHSGFTEYKVREENSIAIIDIEPGHQLRSWVWVTKTRSAKDNAIRIIDRHYWLYSCNGEHEWIFNV